MSLEVGKQLGIYTVVGPLGAGGMGEVYRATDTKLDREVALKVLPDAMARDPERVARFEREAKLLASLNHPQIAAIYGFEQAEGKRFLVLELVEGATLAERIAAGRLMVEESLDIARQIAEALEAAHDNGIIHRDLKPANVKITPEGQVKVLDFGLAKALAEEDPDTEMSPGTSPTITQHYTKPGVILGTAAYMSPEQARGRPVDKRADIWAFAVLLCEMLTGRRMFEAPTVPETLAQVLTRTPDLGGLPGATPAAIRRLLRRCLAREPKNRLHDIADARIVLDDVVAGIVDPAEAASAPSPAVPRSPIRSLLWPAAVVVASVGAGLLGYFLSSSREPAPREPQRLAIHLEASQELVVGANAVLVFSPDGGSLIVSARENGRWSLFRRELGQREATPIPGTDNAGTPFFSPDGRWIGFSAGGQLMKVPVEGGRLSQTSAFVMAAVSSRGTLAYVTESLGNPPRELVWLDRTGRAVPAIDEHGRYLSVNLSPDGR